MATCGAYDILRRDDEVMPREGQVEIVLDGSGNPVCAIESWKVDIKRYDEIDEQFARDEALRRSGRMAGYSRGLFSPQAVFFRPT